MGPHAKVAALQDEWSRALANESAHAVPADAGPSKTDIVVSLLPGRTDAEIIARLRELGFAITPFASTVRRMVATWDGGRSICAEEEPLVVAAAVLAFRIGCS